MRLEGRAVTALVLCALTILTWKPAAATGLDLVPALTPAVMVVKKPLDLLERVNSLKAPAGVDPSGDAKSGEDLPSLPGLGSLPEGVDLEGEIIIAMPQFPFPLIVLPVSDYGLFLESLRGGPSRGGDRPQQSPSPFPGMDSVVWDGKPLFVRQEGGHALLSPTPLLLTPPAPGASLETVLGAEERALLKDSEVFLRLDVGVILALADPFLQQYLQKLDSSPQAEPQSDGGDAPAGLDPEVRQLLLTELDLLMRGVRQVRSFTVGGTLAGDAARISTLYLPQPASGFERLLGGLRPGRHELLRYFDADAVMAGAFAFDAGAMKELVTTVSGVLLASDIYRLSEAERLKWEGLVQAGLETAGRRSAWYFGPSKGESPFSTLVLSEVKDVDRVRGLIRESLGLTEKILSASDDGSSSMRIEMKERVEVHGGVAIDRISFRPSTGDEEEDRKLESAMGRLLGTSSLDVWLAFTGDLMVASYYTGDSGELKVMLDRLKGKEGGGFVESSAFAEATAGLPEESLSLSFLSFPRFLSLVKEAAKVMAPEEDLPAWPLKDEEASGIGFAYSAREGALRVDTRIPRREISNIRTVIEFLQGLDKKGDQGVHGADVESVPL